MRISVAKKLLFATVFSFVLFALLSAESRFQNTSPSPTPSPSPSASPKPSATPTPLPGAQNFHQWGSITVFNGLPSDSVRAIAQTNDGVMWFGTDNGLARFDGRRIQNFSPGDADGSKSILALEYDEKGGSLLIGTRSGAFVYSGNRFEPIAGAESYAITTLLLTDRLYLGTDEGLVLQTSPSANENSPIEKVFADPIKTIEGNPAPITSLITDGDRLLAASSGRGVFSVTAEGPQLFGGAAITPFANTLLRDDQGNVWIGSDAPRNTSGVYVLESGKKPFRIAAPTSKVLSLERNENGAWAGTERFGLFQFTGQKLKKNYTFENTSGGLRSNTVYTLFTDREGVLWIGTNRGVSRFDQIGLIQETISDIPNSNFIRTLFFNHTKGGRYEYVTVLAGSNRGLFDFNGEEWTEVPEFRGRPIYAIDVVPGTHDSIIVATPNGVFDQAGHLILEGDARDINYFAGHTYVAVFGKGIFDITVRPPRLVFPNASITALGGYREKMWIGTNGNGLYSFDGEKTKLELGAESLKSGSIWTVGGSSDKALQEGKEEVMLSGQHGVYIIRNGVPEQLLAAEDVRDFLGTAEDFLAATTSSGLIHAKRDLRFGWLVNPLGFEQGLPSEKAFSIMPTDFGVLVATNRGIVRYTKGTVAPKIIATRLLSQRAHDLSELANKIDLEYPQNSLLVEVAGQSSRTFPEEFQYAFVLTNGKGEEVARQLSNDPQYAPSELKPGDYTIEAIAFNRDLLASEPLFIRFSVAKAPFPWTATALGILLAIAIVGLVWAIVEHRRIAQRNRELAAARFDLANEAERERRRIARDLHDQTLADLRNLMLLSDKISPDKPEFRAEIESVSSEIRRICEDLSPSVLENVGLVASLEFLLKRTIENSSFTAEENLEDRIRIPMNAQLQVYRIAQEVLTNIKKHSSADRVDMSVSVDQETRLCLVIKDNGERFDQNRKNSAGRGITNIRARASLMGAKVDWSAERTNGNRFTLTVEA